jgi:hypothetical protein
MDALLADAILIAGTQKPFIRRNLGGGGVMRDQRTTSMAIVVTLMV